MEFDQPLPPDAYTLTVPFSAVTGATGSALDGDGDGLPGDTFAFQFSSLPIVLGDMNCDGELNGQDVDTFVLAAWDSSTYEAAQPGCNILNSDFDGDHVVGTSDIILFIELLIGTE